MTLHNFTCQIAPSLTFLHKSYAIRKDTISEDSECIGDLLSELFPSTLPWTMSDSRVLAFVICPRYFKIPLKILEDRHLSTPIFSWIDWFVFPAVHGTRSIRRQYHIFWASVFFPSFCHMVQVSDPYRKIEKTAVRASLIFIFLLTALSYYILLGSVMAFLAIHFHLPTILQIFTSALKKKQA